MKPPARELDVLLAVARGRSLRQIARTFHLTEVAVRESLVRTRERYRAPNNEAAIARALDRDDLVIPMPRKKIRLEGEEQTLLGLIADGHSDKQLIAMLHESRSHIDRRVAALLQKLKASNRCHGVYIGFSHGLIVLGAATHTVRQGRDSEVKAIEAIATSGDLAEAARKMSVELSTAKSYLQRSRRRHNARTTQHLVALAVRNGELTYANLPLSSVKRLTQQELQALLFMADGLHDPEVAEKVEVTVRKTGPLINGALQKLNAKSRSHAVLILFQQGVLK